MREISVEMLKQMMDSQEDFQLIDIREEYERNIAEIGGELIPMALLLNNLDRISKNKKVVFYCHSGNRSSQIVTYLEKECNFENLYSLTGGTLAWSDKIDPTVPKY